MTTSQPTQIHPTLHHSSQQIRLLSLCEDVGGKLACNISVFDLSDFPQYIALSYVWGSADVQHEINLNGQPFLIRHNLYLALKSISRHVKAGDGERDGSLQRTAFTIDVESPPRHWKYFWIDAVGINQTNIRERNHQVRLMSNIYKSAAFVLVWLGPSCEQALDLLATADESSIREVFEPYTDRFRASVFSEPLIPFLSSNYWTRMWIVQEFVLANNLLFAASSVLASWDCASHLFPNIYASRCPGPYAPAIKLVNERRQHIFRQKQGIQPDLLELVQRFGLLDCSDPRDRVFALSGLIKNDLDEARDILPVDYSLTPAHLAVKIVGLAGRSIKHRELLESLHDWLKLALEVDEHDVNGEVGEELQAVLDQAMGEQEEGDFAALSTPDPSPPILSPIWSPYSQEQRRDLLTKVMNDVDRFPIN